MYEINEVTFKSIANTLRDNLSDKNISLKLRKSYDLLSYALAEKYWSALSPSLLQDFDIPDTVQAERMSDWLSKHDKPCNVSTCESIFTIAFVTSITEWTYLDDLPALAKQKTPLLSHYDRFDRPNTAVIYLNPEQKTIFTEDYPNPGAPDVVYNRLFAFEVPGDISGKSLVEILIHPVFLSLIESIEKSWVLEWNGRNHIGRIDNDTRSEIEKFTAWLSYNDDVEHHYY